MSVRRFDRRSHQQYVSQDRVARERDRVFVPHGPYCFTVKPMALIAATVSAMRTRTMLSRLRSCP